jgi:ubiquinone/menaquinone biosynthesis C-methylase UbiE
MEHDYDVVAKIYDPALYLFLRSTRKTVLKELREHKEKSILDLCCGTGNQLKLLSKNGFKDLHGLDLSGSMLDVAKKSCSTIDVYKEDAVETNFDKSLFDVVMISFAVHEKDRSTQCGMLKEVYRILKKDGLLLIVDFDFDSKTAKIGKMGIAAIERMAGKEHYANFKNFIKNNGLSSLIKEDRFEFIKSTKRVFNGIGVLQYKKK